MKKLVCALAFLSLALGCFVDKEWKVVDHELGYSVVFPGHILVFPGTDREIQKRPDEWKPTRRKEQTPFGEIIWFTRTYAAGGKMYELFIVEVGTLPPGEQGGTSQEEILTTMKTWIGTNYPGPTADLSYDRGPGFEYFHKKISGNITNGVVVFRRGRIHHARGTAPTPKNPKLINFLKSFQVDP